MAFFRRRADIVQAFRNDPQLEQFVLAGVTPTGRVLGTGSYGSVEEVMYQRLICAGKKLHEALIDVENEGVAVIVRKYLQECQLMASLRHPNITQFLGICYLPGTRLPLLVMERLETSLDDLLEHMPNLPLSLKRSVLEDVASGLLYLHNFRPSPVIHRDLTSRNVLLTASLVAKITDMGNSRIVDMRPGQMARTLTRLPGTASYMPPEALGDRHRYGPALDIFSFGHLALFTITQKFPGDLLPSTFCDPDNTAVIRGRSELERREQYIDLLESLGANHPALVQLVKQCLLNDPHQRPSTDYLLARLQGMKVEVEGEYGGSPIRLDMVRVRLAKEVKMKDRRIEELTQQQERHEAQFEEGERHNQELLRDIQTKDEQIATKEREMTNKDEQITTKERELANKDEQIATNERELVNKYERELANKDEQHQNERTQLEELSAALQSKEAEILRLRLLLYRNVSRKDILRCVLCGDGVDVKLLPCGHVNMCHNCAPRARKCLDLDCRRVVIEHYPVCILCQSEAVSRTLQPCGHTYCSGCGLGLNYCEACRQLID